MAVLLITAYAALGIVMLVVIVRDQFGRGRHQHSPYQDHGTGGPDGDGWHNGDGDGGGGDFGGGSGDGGDGGGGGD